MFNNDPGGERCPRRSAVGSEGEHCLWFSSRERGGPGSVKQIVGHDPPLVGLARGTRVSKVALAMAASM